MLEQSSHCLPPILSYPNLRLHLLLLLALDCTRAPIERPSLLASSIPPSLPLPSSNTPRCVPLAPRRFDSPDRLGAWFCVCFGEGEYFVGFPFRDREAGFPRAVIL